jgi:O-antigen/teichoic acid export membrane protein
MWFVMISVLFIFFYDLSSLINYSYTWIIWLYIWVIISLLIFYKKYYKIYFKNEKIIFEKNLVLKISKYAWLVFIWASAWTILGQIDMQMIIYLLDTTQAWYYTNYLSIIWIPFIIIWPIFWLLFPIFSEMNSKWEVEKIKLIKSIFEKNFLALWIAFNILFFVFAEIIAYTLFWEKFIESWVILKYSILLLVFNLLLQINFNIMAWIWKVSERVKIIFIAVVFNFITNLIFINLIWVYWAALATWIGWILIWILSEYYLWKEYKTKFNYKYLFKNIFLMWWLWIIIYKFVLIFFEWLSRINSMLLLTAFSIIYFWIFIIINYSEFRFFILEIKRLKKWN